MEKSIKNLMILSWVVTILLMSSVFMLFFVYQKRREFEVRSESLRENYILASRKTTRQTVDDAVEFLRHELSRIEQEGDEGAKTEKSLQLHLAATLEKLRFQDAKSGSRLFVIDQKGIVVFHPNPVMLGKNLADLVDVRGGNPFYHLINQVREGRGSVAEYRIFDTTLGSYVKYLVYGAPFPRWNWIMCGELSLNPLENAIRAQEEELKSSLIKDTLVMGGIALAVTLVAIGLSLQFSRSMNRQIGKLLEFFKNPSVTDNPISEDDFEFSELRFISRSSFEMAGKILDLNQELAKMLSRAKDMAIQAESGSQAKTCITMNVSREIRNHMAGIVGYAEFLAETPINEEQRSYVNAILNANSAMVKLLDELRDFSHIESGWLELKPFPFNLKKSLESAMQPMTELAANKNLEFETVIAKEIPEYVMGDENRLKLVISVLIGNAIRFTPTGYVKFLVACSDNAGKNGGKRGIRFSVQDSGVGISSEKLATLFEFATETTPESGKFSGVSLGLAVCKRIVSLMGGQIGVESEKGVGTTVSIEIPFQTADEDETHELQLAEQFPMQTTEILRNWNLNILLAEDDSINQSVTKLYLNRFGCRVDIAANGREAVERFKKTKYDLIFMDCEMPEMDGLAAVRAIRKIEGKKSHVPIIALTASTMKGDRTMCLTTGMDEHVVKPINRRIIKEILSKYHRPVPVPEEINAEASTTREC